MPFGIIFIFLLINYFTLTSSIENNMLIRTDKATLPPKPEIWGGSKYFLEGETFSLNCNVIYQKNSAVMLSWKIPREIIKEGSVVNQTNEREITDGKLFYNLTIINANVNDAGPYVCISKNSNGEQESVFEKVYLAQPFINLTKGNKADPIETKQRIVRLQVIIKDYPASNVLVLRDNEELPIDQSKYAITKTATGSVVLTIRNLNVTDTANYTVVAGNRYLSKNVTFDLRVKAPPITDFGPSADKRYLKNTRATLKCSALGYPIPKIMWSFSNGDQYTISGEITQVSIYNVTSYLELPVNITGNVTCIARNSEGTSSSTRRFLVYEMPGGFGIKGGDHAWFSEQEDVKLKCIASKYDFTNLTWLGSDGEELIDMVTYSENSFSYIASLRLDQISLDQQGNYTCLGLKVDGSEENLSVEVLVAEKRAPVIAKPSGKQEQEVYPYQPVQLTCQADAVPPPTIQWYKDGELVIEDKNVEIEVEKLNHSSIISVVDIKQMQEENKGKYECIATSSKQVETIYYNLILKEKFMYKTAYLSIIGIIIITLIATVVYLTWRVRKEKEFRRELAAAGLLYFKEGVTKSLNPDLGIDEQAELLPYDEKFEFPAEKLVFGKQLGAGAFGVVYKAEARGIVNAEESTTVAVKMVKKTADNMYIKALASELKIMVHLGKHINIVNLLGACTKNVGKRELIVIVEYCKFGNVHNYLQKHREVFIDQFADSKEKSFGKVNRGFSSSTANSTVHSDYFGSNSQETDHTFINTANSNRSGRKVSETGYIQPEWRSNYESDYSDGRAPRPLTTRDLLAWAFQIARGMDYLASRKVLHGDLAARNILLAEDNVVKICDFGLARSIYKNDEYQKKENTLLPVKWLAIECMMDRIFSTQSDVWSFGIVLWELFSLAKTPYPNMSPPSLLQWLTEGKRLEKPAYSDDRLYEVMLQCWRAKPLERPSFSQLQDTLGSFLEDSVRNHYVDLNASYIDMNEAKANAGGADYLAMVSAPDYGALVTPSPRIYVNDCNFFPPHADHPAELEHDEEGYLKMSPIKTQNNPRPQSNKHDYDARKFNMRTSDPSSQGSELTPMLSLTPLNRGLDSDYEGRSSPYLPMCPRIEEESDEVFEAKQNNKNLQNTAVTNPSYITYDVTNLDQKSKEPASGYINVDLSNRLVI